MSQYYIKIKPCGCVTGAVVENIEDCHKLLEEWKKEGAIVEIVGLEAVKRLLRECKCRGKKK